MKNRTILGTAAALAVLVIGAAEAKSTYASVAFDVSGQMANMKTDIKSTLNIDVELEEGEGSRLTYKPEGFLAYVHLTTNDTILKANDINPLDTETLNSLQNYYENWLETNDFSDYGGNYIKYFDNNATDKEIIICIDPEVGGADIFYCNTVNIVDGVASGYNVENKAMVNKLAMAYEAAGHDISDSVIGPVDTLEDRIVESEEYDGYAYLMTGITSHSHLIGGGYGLWYRTSKEGEWKYFDGGQAALDCSKYNTEDLQKAFSGTVCYDEKEGKNSTVAFIKKKAEDDENKKDVGTPDTGYNFEDTSSMAIRTVFIAAPAALIVVYIAKYTYGRMSKKVKFTKR